MTLKRSDRRVPALAEEAEPSFYVPQGQFPFPRQTVVIATKLADATAFVPTIRLKSRVALTTRDVRCKTSGLRCEVSRAETNVDEDSFGRHLAPLHTTVIIDSVCREANA